MVYRRGFGALVVIDELHDELETVLVSKFKFPVEVLTLSRYAHRDLVNYRMIRRNRLARRLLEKMSRRLLEEHVGDPELRAKLTPHYEIGCKRVLITNDFYASLTKPNVELVASAVREVREGSLVAEDGTEREVDAIIFATGFETSNSPILSRIRSRDGRSINEIWNGRPRFHRAPTIAGFPNFFNLCGAGTGFGHGLVVWKAESQTTYVIDALRVMRERNLSSFEVRPDVQDRYMRWVDEDLDSTVWVCGGCRSWYLDDGGRPSLMWPRTMWGFRRMLRRFDAGHYRLRSAREARPDVEQGEAVASERSM